MDQAENNPESLAALRTFLILLYRVREFPAEWRRLKVWNLPTAQTQNFHDVRRMAEYRVCFFLIEVCEHQGFLSTSRTEDCMSVELDNRTISKKPDDIVFYVKTRMEEFPLEHCSYWVSWGRPKLGIEPGGFSRDREKWPDVLAAAFKRLNISMMTRPGGPYARDSHILSLSPMSIIAALEGHEHSRTPVTSILDALFPKTPVTAHVLETYGLTCQWEVERAKERNGGTLPKQWMRDFITRQRGLISLALNGSLNGKTISSIRDIDDITDISVTPATALATITIQAIAPVSARSAAPAATSAATPAVNLTTRSIPPPERPSQGLQSIPAPASPSAPVPAACAPVRRSESSTPAPAPEPAVPSSAPMPLRPAPVSAPVSTSPTRASTTPSSSSGSAARAHETTPPNPAPSPHHSTSDASELPITPISSSLTPKRTAPTRLVSRRLRSRTQRCDSDSTRMWSK